MKKPVKMISVIATAAGFDGIVTRQPGEEFSMPATVFDKRPKLGPDKKPTGEFYDLPSWFRKKSPEREAAVRAREQARSARVVADASPENKGLQTKADDADEKATELEAKADKLDAESEAGSDLA